MHICAGWCCVHIICKALVLQQRHFGLVCMFCRCCSVLSSVALVCQLQQNNTVCMQHY